MTFERLQHTYVATKLCVNKINKNFNHEVANNFYEGKTSKVRKNPKICTYKENSTQHKNNKL